MIKLRISESIQSENIKIGGSGIVVQLDEWKFGKRNYNRGNRVEGEWIFAGVEMAEE
ncbi:hypothetical protein H311_01734 [Anncaliia algerae PRA109]|nr:hypothetical protein H311_01734 [Anncaliia algerae PRA109]